MGNGKNFRVSSAPQSDVSSRDPSFFAELRLLAPNRRVSVRIESSTGSGVTESDMGERLICDICQKEVGLFEIIKLAPLITCERLVCGHWWHITHSQTRTRTATKHQECDCGLRSPDSGRLTGSLEQPTGAFVFSYFALLWFFAGAHVLA